MYRGLYWFNQWFSELGQRIDKFNAYLLETNDPAITSVPGVCVVLETGYKYETNLKHSLNLAPSTRNNGLNTFVEQTFVLSNRENPPGLGFHSNLDSMLFIFFTSISSICDTEIFAVFSILCLAFIVALFLKYSFKALNPTINSQYKNSSAMVLQDGDNESEFVEGNDSQASTDMNLDQLDSDSESKGKGGISGSDKSYNLRKQSTNLGDENVDYFDNWLPEEYTSNTSSIQRIQDNFLFGKIFEEEDDLMDVIASDENIGSKENLIDITHPKLITSSKAVLDNTSSSPQLEPRVSLKNDMTNILKPSNVYSTNTKNNSTFSIDSIQNHFYLNHSPSHNLSNNSLASRIEVDLENELENNLMDFDAEKEQKEKSSLINLLDLYNEGLNPLVMPLLLPTDLNSEQHKVSIEKRSKISDQYCQLPTSIQVILQSNSDFDPVDFFASEYNNLTLDFDKIDTESFLKLKFNEHVKNLTIEIIHIFRFFVSNKYDGDNPGIQEYIKSIHENLMNFVSFLEDSIPFSSKMELVYLVSDLVTFAEDGALLNEQLQTCFQALLNFATANTTEDHLSSQELISANLVIITCALNEASFTECFLEFLVEMVQDLSQDASQQSTKVQMCLQCFIYYISFNKKKFSNPNLISQCLSILNYLSLSLKYQLELEYNGTTEDDDEKDGREEGDNIITELVTLYLVFLEVLISCREENQNYSREYVNHKMELQAIQHLLNPFTTKLLPSLSD